MGKKKQTVGHWYKLLLHLGLCRGPIDALLEFRGGEKTAWKGWAGSGTITVDAKNLWGGEDKEGGIQGDLDVMLGEQDQEPNAYLAEHIGPNQTAYRGRASVVFKGGLYGAFNPYPKPASFLVTRILKGWDDDVCWEPGTVGVPVPNSEVAPKLVQRLGAIWDYQIVPHHADPGYTNLAPPASGWTAGAVGPFGSGSYAYPTRTEWPEGTILWAKRTLTVSPLQTYTVKFRFENGGMLFANGVLIASYNRDNAQITGAPVLYANIPPELVATRSLELVLKAFDETSAHAATYAEIEIFANRPVLEAFNGAHIIYDSITADEMAGEPVDLIDQDSFKAAADRLWSEGMGLATKYDPTSETVEQFQQRILNVIGGSLSQSRVNGRYYLTLVRGDYSVEALPVLEDDDILEYSEEPTDPREAVNQVTVKWFDPIRKEARTTAPQQSLGAIQAAGGIIAETANYPEIIYETLAARLAARDLSMKSTPLKRFNLTTNRRPYAWRAGEFFRLQAPRRGIADMVCMVGEIDAGTPRSGTMRLVAVQDVTAMPSTTYTDPEGDTGEAGDGGAAPPPAAPTTQLAIEAPYTELAGMLSAVELDVTPADAGFLLAMARRPTTGDRYALFTAADGEEYAERGAGDWCPTALVVEAATADPAPLAVTLSDATDLDLVTVGSAALWGDEIVRVDALDLAALTATLARGCVDTVPQEHAAGERLWWYDLGGSTDSREYSDGELVSAKLLTRTASELADLEDTAAVTVTMDGRKHRPYPPGLFQIDGAPADGSAKSETFTVSWVDRDRILQADQLVDTQAASIGPEPGTSYTLQVIDATTETTVMTTSGLGGNSATVLLPVDYPALRVELWAVREGLVSWQRQVSPPFAYTAGAAGTDYGTGNPGSPGDTTGTPATPPLADDFAVATGINVLAADFDQDHALVDGLQLRVRAANANTGPATFSHNGSAALPLEKHGGVELEAGDIAAEGHELIVRYRSSPARWELVNPAIPVPAPAVALAIVGGVVTLDASLGDFFTLALTANATLAIVNAPASGCIILELTQTGAFALSMPVEVATIGGPYVTTVSTAEPELLGFITMDGASFHLVAKQP